MRHGGYVHDNEQWIPGGGVKLSATIVIWASRRKARAVEMVLGAFQRAEQGVNIAMTRSRRRLGRRRLGRWMIFVCIIHADTLHGSCGNLLISDLSQRDNTRWSPRHVPSCLRKLIESSYMARLTVAKSMELTMKTPHRLRRTTHTLPSRVL